MGLLLAFLLLALLIVFLTVYFACECVGMARLVLRLRRSTGPPACREPGSLLGGLVILPTIALVLGLISPAFDLALAYTAGSMRSLPSIGLRFAVLPAWFIAVCLVIYAMKNPQWPYRRSLGAGAAGLMAFIMACLAFDVVALLALHLPRLGMSAALGTICGVIVFFPVLALAVTCLNLILFIAVLCRGGTGSTNHV